MSKKFSSLKEDNFNTNLLGSVSDSLIIEENNVLCFSVTAVSGTHSNHEIALEISTDGNNWFTTESEIEGLGILDNIKTSAKFVRCKVTKIEDSPSVCELIIQSK